MPREPHEPRHRFLGRGRVAGPRQPFGDLPVAGIFAVDQHAVEIEQHRTEPHQPRAPNSALPTRTCVAPIITAVSKSSDIPIDKPSSPASRASFASSAK